MTILRIDGSGAKSSKIGNPANFFVWKNLPFVGTNLPHLVPFVGNSSPLTHFRPIGGRAQGFTLVELVVTMAVALILVTIAAPNLRVFIQNSRLATQVNDLIADVNFARSEAIKRRSNVGVCKSTNSMSCAGGGAWRDGRLVFADMNNNGSFDVGETVLRFREQLGGSDDTLTSPGPDPVIFDSRGAASSPAGGTTFTFCDNRGASNGKLVNLNSTGQATVAAGAPGGC